MGQKGTLGPSWALATPGGGREALNRYLRYLRPEHKEMNAEHIKTIENVY